MAVACSQGRWQGWEGHGHMHERWWWQWCAARGQHEGDGKGGGTRGTVRVRARVREEQREDLLYTVCRCAQRGQNRVWEWVAETCGLPMMGAVLVWVSKSDTGPIPTTPM